MLLELNSQLFDIFNRFSYIPWIGIIADAPIFFLPLFLSGMWIYYTFNPHTFFSQRKKRYFKMWTFLFFKRENSQLRNSKRHDLLHIFYACILWLIFSYIIKLFVDIDRPETYLKQTGNLIMSTIPAKSFPSDHATVSFAFTTALFFTGFKKVWYIFLPCIILMNISRIIVWVHWPIDILAGAINGIIASIICFTYIIPGKLVKKSDIFIIEVMRKLKLY